MPRYELTVVVDDDAPNVTALFSPNDLEGDNPFRAALRDPSRFIHVGARRVENEPPLFMTNSHGKTERI